MTAECTCPLAPEEYQHRYGGATEPGGALEYDPECPEHGQSRPECPKGNPTVVTTSSGGSQAASEPLGGQPGAFPDVRFVPASRFGWSRPVAVIRVTEERPQWRGTNGTHPTDEQVADAQRLVPVGPLLALAEEWLSQGAYHGSDLRALLASLLGESPSRQEGTP